MQEVLSRAIEDEENRRHEPREVRPGVFEIFQTEEELDRADRASRVAGSDSLVNFCREVIFDAADHLLKQEAAAGIQQGQSAEDTRLDPDPAADPEKNGESAA